MPVLPATANAAATAAHAANAERQSPSAQARAAPSEDAKNFGALVASFAKLQGAAKSEEA